jgi:hypothetical protein
MDFLISQTEYQKQQNNLKLMKAAGYYAKQTDQLRSSSSIDPIEKV